MSRPRIAPLTHRLNYQIVFQGLILKLIFPDSKSALSFEEYLTRLGVKLEIEAQESKSDILTLIVAPELWNILLASACLLEGPLIGYYAEFQDVMSNALTLVHEHPEAKGVEEVAPILQRRIESKEFKRLREMFVKIYNTSFFQQFTILDKLDEFLFDCAIVPGQRSCGPIPNDASNSFKLVKKTEMFLKLLPAYEGAFASENFNSSITNSNNQNILFFASSYDATDYWLSLGANPNQVDNDGNSPLHIACQNNRLGVVQRLLKVEDIKANLPNNQGNTPLHLLASYIFSSKHWFDGFIVITSAYLTYIEIMRILAAHIKEFHHNINQVNEDKQTPLHIVFMNYIDAPHSFRNMTYPSQIVKILCENGADTNLLLPPKGEKAAKSLLTTLYDADFMHDHHLETQHTEMVRLLVHYGAKFDNSDESILINCLTKHNSTSLKYALEKGVKFKLETLLNFFALIKISPGTANHLIDVLRTNHPDSILSMIVDPLLHSWPGSYSPDYISFYKQILAWISSYEPAHAHVIPTLEKELQHYRSQIFEEKGTLLAAVAEGYISGGHYAKLIEYLAYVNKSYPEFINNVITLITSRLVQTNKNTDLRNLLNKKNWTQFLIGILSLTEKKATDEKDPRINFLMEKENYFLTGLVLGYINSNNYNDFQEIINEAKPESDFLKNLFLILARLFVLQNVSDNWFLILRYNIHHLNAAAIFLSGITIEFDHKSQDIPGEKLFKTFCLLGESKEIHSIKRPRDKNNESALIKELRVRSTPYHNHQLFCQETKQTPVNFDQFRISSKRSMPVLLLQFNSFLTHEGTRKEINPTALTFLVASYLIGPMPYEEYSFFRSRHMEVRKKASKAISDSDKQRYSLI